MNIDAERDVGRAIQKSEDFEQKRLQLNIWEVNVKCGWSGNQAALQFHHKDPSRKILSLVMSQTKVGTP